MEAGGSKEGKRRGRRGAKQEVPAVETLSVSDAAKRMKKLEKEMYDAARNLEFERAAELRDELDTLRTLVFKGEGVVSTEPGTMAAEADA